MKSQFEEVEHNLIEVKYTQRKRENKQKWKTISIFKASKAQTSH